MEIVNFCTLSGFKLGDSDASHFFPFICAHGLITVKVCVFVHGLYIAYTYYDLERPVPRFISQHQCVGYMASVIFCNYSCSVGTRSASFVDAPPCLNTPDNQTAQLRFTVVFKSRDDKQHTGPEVRSGYLKER